MRRLCLRLSLSLLFLPVACPASLADDGTEKLVRTISVSGHGRATAPPDMATVRTGVETRAETAGEALEANSRSLRRVMDVLKANRIADKDIQTSDFSVRPEYRHNQRGGQPPEVVGYHVSNHLTARVRNLPALGSMLDALVQAGSNQISGITFGIDDETGVLNQARNRAISNARAQAELYAQAAGVKVGRVISIREQGAAEPPPQPMFRAMAVAESAVPVATGEQELGATIQMVFELLDR